MLGRDLGLDAAPRPAITRDYDGTLHGHSQAVEPLVVFGHAVVDIDQRRRDIAIDRVGVVGGQLLVVLAGGGIASYGRLGELGRETLRRDHFEGARLGSGEEHLEGFDVGVQAPLFELRQDPLGVVLIVGRADVMRAGGQALHVVVQILGAGSGAEHYLPVVFGVRRFRRVAAQDGGVGGGRERCAEEQGQTGQVRCDLHQGKNNRGALRATWLVVGVWCLVAGGWWTCYFRGTLETVKAPDQRARAWARLAPPGELHER